MQGLILWKENEFSRLRRDLETIFKRRCRDFGIPLFTEAPDIYLELSETETELILTARLSGVRPEAIDISASEESIVLQAESQSRNITEDAHFRKVEEKTSTFRRRVALPVRVKVEEIQAVFENPYLRIVMPKSDPRQRRTIKPQIR